MLVVVALLLTDWLLWEPGLTEDNVRRIRPGMTLAEVEELLGGPARETIDWWAEGGLLVCSFLERPSCRPCLLVCVLMQRRVRLLLFADEDQQEGIVTLLGMGELGRPPPSLKFPRPA